MPSPDRIRTMRDVTALVALDTVELLAERVTNLLSHGRRMSLTHRYTYTDHPPDVFAGLTLLEEPTLWRRDHGIGFDVRLQPGVLAGFGFSAYCGESDTEADAWRRYHATNDKRRDVTLLGITGGMAGDGPARNDKLVIRRWNRDGVCIEQVIAFDYDESLAYIPPNLDGCDWVWEDRLGHSVQISGSGQILTGDDEWVSLSPEQWGELARVAIYMRDADIDPTEWKD